MRRLPLALFILMLAASCFAQRPIVRASLSPEKGIIVGQPVHLSVTVLVPNYFTGSVDLPEFELENAIVVLPQDRPQHSSETIDGLGYAGIAQTYTIYPQQPGDFRLPAAAFSAPYANAPPKSTNAKLTLPSLSFHAGLPAAAAGLDYFLPTTQLTMQQKWSRPFKDLRAGDSVERTITITATRMQAMLIPALPLEAQDGLRVYPEEPSVQDQKTNRGDFVSGRRIQSAKYFIRKEGDYTLPAVELKWWNLSTSRIVTATLPAVHFTAAADPNYVAELPPEAEPAAVTPEKHVSFWTKYKLWIETGAPSVIALLLVLWTARRYLPRLRRSLRAWRDKRKVSEAEYFRELQQACKQNRQTQAYQYLLRWLGLVYPRTSLGEFLRIASDPDLSSEVESLAGSLFSPVGKQPWNGRRMVQLLRRHRKTMRPPVTSRRLRELNP